MATYSLAITGKPADSPYLTATLTLPDTGALPGSMAAAMQNNTPLLCMGPNGSLGFFVLDAERSTPTVPVLLRVG